MLSSACILASPVVKARVPVGIVLYDWSRPAWVRPMQQAYRKRRSRLRVEGPLAPYLEPYAEHIAERGYSQVSYWKKTFLISEFSRWLGEERIAAGEIAAEHEAAFLRDRARHRILKGGDTISLSGITSWLRDKGIVNNEPAVSTGPSGIEAILQEYAGWLREDRGLAPSTIENYAGYIWRFLTSICSADEPRLADISASQVTDYIRRNAPRDRTFSQAKNIVTSLRSFFRFARYRDYIQTDLAAVVPSVAGWSMASIPRAMPADCVRRLLNESKTWRTPAGLRNRAILLLLARLGLRAREIVRLELDDIDWSQGWLRVHGKGREERPLPMPHDVGEAVASYLKNGRPESTCRGVFLRSRAPFDELKTQSDICQIVHRAIDRAGIEVKVTGSHQLRHALAVDMLRQGISLTEIGQVLRHRSPEATRRYAKIDLDGLREVALPWPGELP
ncbi:tyrosine-type recombinase/integrase [Reyranella sp.]|uniref:tyrosine-type recombinase/integrase n=1 Tax=Reyranella sp. TaxID=1929291 RepID=UPI0027307192|nr:tyrosine-type recombinase/integrase [Reyranella sp.]MDP2373604.1 tyrosine-type recombinase/integrase [Reyranella sp.]